MAAMKDEIKTTIRVTVDAEYLETLKSRLGVTSNTALMRIAMTLLDWASATIQDGRQVLSADSEGKNAHRVPMPELAGRKPIPQFAGITIRKKGDFGG